MVNNVQTNTTIKILGCSCILKLFKMPQTTTPFTHIQVDNFISPITRLGEVNKVAIYNKELAKSECVTILIGILVITTAIVLMYLATRVIRQMAVCLNQIHDQE